KRAKDTQYFKDMVMLSEARDRGVQLDAKAEAFLAGIEYTEPLDGPLAITTTTAFQVEHEDGYDSDANLDLIETKDSLTPQLESCKLELKNLEWNKVKLESDQLFV
nr:hypothetical protein [Tanacetum cinerariifolium]